jgi:hypothetical protein
VAAGSKAIGGTAGRLAPGGYVNQLRRSAKQWHVLEPHGTRADAAAQTPVAYEAGVSPLLERCGRVGKFAWKADTQCGRR